MMSTSVLILTYPLARLIVSLLPSHCSCLYTNGYKDLVGLDGHKKRTALLKWTNYNLLEKCNHSVHTKHGLSSIN